MAQKKYKANQAANKLITNLVKSMHPEHRPHLHEGLRVAHKAQILDALEAAFCAGQVAGCTFERD